MNHKSVSSIKITNQEHTKKAVGNMLVYKPPDIERQIMLTCVLTKPMTDCSKQNTVVQTCFLLLRNCEWSIANTISLSLFLLSRGHDITFRFSFLSFLVVMWPRDKNKTCPLCASVALPYIVHYRSYGAINWHVDSRISCMRSFYIKFAAALIWQKQCFPIKFDNVSYIVYQIYDTSDIHEIPKLN